MAGRIGTSKTNGNTIFLPAAGFRKDADLYYAGYPGHHGTYQSSSLYEDGAASAVVLYFDTGIIEWLDLWRPFGRSVRAVVK